MLNCGHTGLWKNDDIDVHCSCSAPNLDYLPELAY